MLSKKEFLKLTPEERDVIFLRCLWRFFFNRQDFNIALLAKKTDHSEDFINKTLLKTRRITRLQFEIYDLNSRIKKLLESIFDER